ATRVLHQVIEDAEFGRAQMHLAIAALHTVSDAVNDDVADNDLVLSQRRANAAHDGAETRQKLRHRERLGDVVVSANVETTDTVAFLAARGEHNDRRVARFLARTQAAADFDAGRFWQHPI